MTPGCRQNNIVKVRCAVNQSERWWCHCSIAINMCNQHLLIMISWSESVCFGFSGMTRQVEQWLFVFGPYIWSFWLSSKDQTRLFTVKIAWTWTLTYFANVYSRVAALTVYFEILSTPGRKWDSVRHAMRQWLHLPVCSLIPSRASSVCCGMLGPLQRHQVTDVWWLELESVIPQMQLSNTNGPTP